MTKKGIVVVGSSNVDMIAKVSHLPVAGETVGNAAYSMVYGGKGANQALAAFRAGGDVTFISNVGNDSSGEGFIAHFEENGIDTQHIYKDKDQPTGVALIFVADNGENCIAVAPGANGCLKGDKLSDIYKIIENSEALLLQLEIPFNTVEELINYANKTNTKVIFNPAPAVHIHSGMLKKVDILILNETEAELIVGSKFSESDPFSMAQKIFDKGSKAVILTMGSKGSIVKSVHVEELVPAHKVNVVDTTAAGDTFCGAFLVHWIETKNLIESVQFATAAAALSVMTLGAQSSIPQRSSIEQLLQKVAT